MISAVAQGVRQKGISALARIVSGASFRSSPMRVRVLPLVHDITTELLRLDLCMTTSGDKYLLLRTRHWLRRRAAQQQVRRSAHGAISSPTALAIRRTNHRDMSAASAIHHNNTETLTSEDCLDNVLLLQSVLLRALPELACRYVCLAGSAVHPYEPDYDADVGIQVHEVNGSGLSDHQLPGFDDGCGVAVRPLARLGQHGEQNFALDPLSYLKIVCGLLDRDARLDADVGDTQLWRPNAAFASETLDDDLSERRHPRRGVQAGSAPGADDVQVFFIRVLDFFAAVAAGPIAADGRSCADHVLEFIHPPYARVRESSKHRQSSAMFNPSGSLNASFANDTEDDNSLEAPPVLEQAVDDSTHSCPEQLRLQSLLGSLAQTTTAMDPDHGRLREVAYNNACRAQQEQSASAQAAEQSLAAVPLVDVYRRGLGYVLSQKGGVARIAMKLVFLPSYSTDTNSARWRTLSTPLLYDLRMILPSCRSCVGWN